MKEGAVIKVRVRAPQLRRTHRENGPTLSERGVEGGWSTGYYDTLFIFNRNKNISYNEIIIYGGINMRILAIFGLVIGVIIVKEYLVDMIAQYYVNKEKEAKRQHILNMKL